MRRLLSAALCCLTVLVMLSGCGADDFKLYYDIAAPVATFDPQLASSESELLISGNLFEGLYRLNADGDPVLAAAKSCDISADKTRYRFTLRDGACWEDGSPLTADDFLFAFERALNPNTESPSASSLFCIKNAEKFYSGGISFDEVGIAAENAVTLSITLNAPNENFPVLLTKSCCMPCNRSFFGSTKGRYGLNKLSVLSNGSFSLQYFDEETGGVTLTRNGEYNGRFVPSAYSVAISVAGDGTAARLTERRVDGGRVRYDEQSRLDGELFNITAFDSGVCSLAFNANLDRELRSILIGAVDFATLKQTLPNTLPPADGILPPSLKAGDSSDLPVYDSAGSRAKFSDYSVSNAVPALRVLCLNDPPLGEITRKIIAYWQNGLGLYNIKLETVDTDSELMRRLSSHDYDIAFAVFNDSDGNITDYLACFTSDSPQNYLNRDAGKFDSYAAAYKAGGKPEDLQNALSALSDEKLIIPVCEVRKVYAMSAEFDGAIFRNYGTELDFALITD